MMRNVKKPSALSLVNLPVDLWFCYGSFFYGIEGALHDCEDQTIEVILSPGSAQESAELMKFLEMILEKPKGLLRVELRVYVPEKTVKKLRISSPIFLFTDLVPQLPQPVEKTGGLPSLQFSSVQGISPSNGESWDKLIHGGSSRRRYLS